MKKTVYKSDDRTVDLTEFFKVLVKAVKAFRGAAAYRHPRANFKGCVIATPVDRRHIRQFGFVDRHSREVILEINMQHLFLNPEMYLDHLMVHLGKAMDQANAEGKILVAAPKKIILSQAVAAAGA